MSWNDPYPCANPDCRRGEGHKPTLLTPTYKPGPRRTTCCDACRQAVSRAARWEQTRAKREADDLRRTAGTIRYSADHREPGTRDLLVQAARLIDLAAYDIEHHRDPSRDAGAGVTDQGPNP
ncbi:MAG: hypothetical protein JWM89_1518 [Acidimicrobiales bacterium]|nr:hypothetical protein [Acidimicrobiales bacterium]